ncbi:hypothetical protein MY4824_009647 [Beauveria thailandica]
MKSSALAAAALLVASSLGIPELSSGASKATPGHIIITNDMNRPLRLQKGAEEIIIPHQGTVQVQARDITMDLMLSEQSAQHSQAEVSYTSGDQGTYDFAIRPVEGEAFPGAIYVFPLPGPSPRCHPLVWYPGQGSTQNATCQDNTPLHVYLREAHHPPL